jgi:transposase
MKETPTYYTGIDVAKDRLDVVLRPSGEYVEATNDERGIHSVVRRLQEKDVALVVLEATGGFEQPAAAALAGVPVAIVNPGRSGTSPRPRASSPRPPGSTPRCSPTSPRR